MAPAAPGGILGQAGQTGSPEAVYNALKEQRKELVRQLETLEEKRNDLSEQLQEPMVSGGDRRGLEQRVTETDQRIAEVDKQIAVAERQIAQAAGVPGAVVEQPPPMEREGPPPEAMVIVPALLTMFVLFPLTLAYARRIWRRSAAAVTSLPAELFERLTRLEQAVDTIAVETERISEGQRFMSKLFAENGGRGALNAPAGAQQPGEPVRR
jgi:DNA repair exonuclease SbcCD ATPase subunit